MIVCKTFIYGAKFELVDQVLLLLLYLIKLQNKYCKHFLILFAVIKCGIILNCKNNSKTTNKVKSGLRIRSLHSWVQNTIAEEYAWEYKSKVIDQSEFISMHTIKHNVVCKYL